MKIAINKSRAIGSIQDDFCRIFPHLRLNVLPQNAEISAGLWQKYGVAEAHTPLEAIGILTHEGDLTISDDMTVADLTYVLHHHFGVKVEILRRAEGFWLETNDEDWWTLAEHNRRAEEALAGEACLASGSLF